MYQPNEVTGLESVPKGTDNQIDPTTITGENAIEPQTINSNEISIIERMKLEAKELDTKLNAIMEFINNNPKYAELSHTAGILLLEQRDVMFQYLDILTKRINLFVEENLLTPEPVDYVEPAETTVNEKCDQDGNTERPLAETTESDILE